MSGTLLLFLPLSLPAAKSKLPPGGGLASSQTRHSLPCRLQPHTGPPRPCPWRQQLRRLQPAAVKGCFLRRRCLFQPPRILNTLLKARRQRYREANDGSCSSSGGRRVAVASAAAAGHHLPPLLRRRSRPSARVISIFVL